VGKHIRTYRDKKSFQIVLPLNVHILSGRLGVNGAVSVAIRDVKKQEPDHVNAQAVNLQRNAQVKGKKKKKCMNVIPQTHVIQSGVHGVLGAVWKIMVVQKKQEPDRVNAKMVILQRNAQAKEHKKRRCMNVTRPQPQPLQQRCGQRNGQRNMEKE